MNKYNDINQYIFKKVSEGKFHEEMAFKILKTLNSKEEDNTDSEDIAIIGMSCKFPGCNNLDEFWKLMVCENSCITGFPKNRFDNIKGFIKKDIIKNVQGGYLEDIASFDAKFFRISPNEAIKMEPSQRVLLQCVYEAFENSGYGGETLKGKNVGVFVGRDHTTTASNYKNMFSEPDTLVLTGSFTGILSSRISYIFNLKGPSIVIDTACSSGLVAVHEACMSLKRKECTMAVASGVQISDFPAGGNLAQMMESTSTELKSFDKEAKGTIWGEGIGVVILKPLKEAIKDKDYIYALIKGSAINNDGVSSGITAPNLDAQTAVIEKAWKEAHIIPENISYIEAHGTGTALGDTIEIKALEKAFAKYTNKKQFCGVGTVKTNLGHTVGASGLASLIKIVLSIINKTIPAMINFRQLNPNISLCNSPLYIQDQKSEFRAVNKIRCAAVSCFGFSGTNCHMVIEEFKRENNTLENKLRNNLAVISARTMESLKQILKDYIVFGSNNTNVDMGNLCYTLANGRGHYSYRIAIRTTNFQEFIQNIKDIISADFHGFNHDGIYFGYHHIVSNKEINIKENNITQKQILELSNKSNNLYDCIVDNNENDINLLGELYVKGAEVNWNSIYANGIKIPLPVYSFEKIKYWPENVLLSEQNSFNRIEDSNIMEYKCISNSINQDIYLVELSVQNCWFIREHKLYGNYTLPGVLYIEMSRKIGELYFSQKTFFISELTLHTPLFVEDAINLQIVVAKKKTYVEISFICKNENKIGLDEDWTTYASSKLFEYNETIQQVVQINNMLDKCTEILEIEKKEEVDRSGEVYLQYGRRWQNVVRGYRISEKEAFVEIKLKDEFVADLQNNFLHPALMDQAINIVGRVLPSSSKYLPYKYGSILVHGKIPQHFYSYFIMKNQEINSSDEAVFNVNLINDENKCIVEIKDYVLRNIEKKEIDLRYQNINHLLYNNEWIYNAKISSMGKKVIHNRILVLRNENIFSNNILKLLVEKNRNSYITEVILGDSFKIIDKNKYQISNLTSDLDKLSHFLEINRQELIVNMLSYNSGKIESVEELEFQLNYGIYGLFSLIKKLIGDKVYQDIGIVNICDNVFPIEHGQAIQPLNAPIFSFAKVAAVENNFLLFKCIDVDYFTEPKDIIDEICCTMPFEQVAYRKGIRYKEELQRIEYDCLPVRKKKMIKNNGVYIITGGIGGIGLKIAQMIGEECQGNILLVSRKDFPKRILWDSILLAGAEKKQIEIITTIRNIEKKGSTVDILSYDISSKEHIKELFNYVTNRFDKLDCIMHCAGIAGKGFISGKTKEDIKAVFASKIIGTWLLNQYMKKYPECSMVLFSSIMSHVGMVGQSDYSSANAFLDAFAVSDLKNNVSSIVWPAWKDVGMAVDNKFTESETLFYNLSSNRGIEILKKICQCEIKKVIVGDFNFKYCSEMVFDNIINVSDDIKKKINQYINKKSDSFHIKKDKKIRIIGKDETKLSQIERTVAKIWCDNLGLQEINIFDKFFEMGGDSIIALNIVSSINNEFEIKSQMFELLEQQCIHNYSEYVKLNYLTYNKKHKDYGIKRIPKSEFYHVSPSQKRMYILYKIEKPSTAYNLPIAMEFKNGVDIKWLQKAINILIQRHEVLRTYFEFTGDVPVQVIVPQLELEIERFEISSNQYDEITAKFIKSFDLGKAPLLRCAFLKIDNKKDVILIDMHHIISDATSISILVKELYQLYVGIELLDLPIQYKDYAQWQIELINSNKYKEQEKFWLDTYKNDEIPVLNMPLDFSRSAIQNFDGDKIYISLENKEYMKLKSQVSNFQSTMFIVLTAALNITLYKYTEQKDIIVGTMISGRSHTDLHNLIGLLVNTLPIRTKIDDGETFLELHSRVKEHILNIYKNQDFQYEELIDKLELKKDMSRNPLFDIMFIFQDSHLISNEEESAEIKLLEIKRNISKFDITIDAIEIDGQIDFTFEYCSNLYTKDTIHQFGKHFIAILKQVLMEPNKQIKDIDILAEFEKKYILGINQSRYVRTEFMIDTLIDNQRRKNPKKVILICKEKRITYEELNMYSNAVANELIEKKVKKGNIIGLLMESSVEMIIAMLGIWKAGAAYLPLDYSFPENRIEYMVKDSKAVFILVQKNIGQKYKSSFPCLEIEEILTRKKIYNPNIVLHKNDLAYVIYTSGTTGNPKGVMIEHGSLSNFIHGILEIIPFANNKSVLCLTTMSFDIFAFETWIPLSKGMSVVIVKEEEKKSPKKLYDLVSSEQINIIQATPSRLQMILNDNKSRCFLENIDVICVGGEVFTNNLLMELKKLTRAKIFNMYGPTETTVWSTVKDLTNTSKITIGKPIRNTDVYILNKNKQLQPPKVVGELFIGGEGLARGYWNQYELTNEKFINNPFCKGEKIYATGDLARINKTGELEIIGRKDCQVKVRGYRIELGEVENAIIKYHCIKETAVIVKEDIYGFNSICAYFTTDADILIQDLRYFLKSILPDYMIPSYFIKVDTMPYTPNGKLNRKELLNLDNGVITEVSLMIPECKEEEDLLNIWKEVLEVTNLGVNDDFFEFGGNSLLLIKLVVKLEEIKFEVDTADIIRCKTVHNLYEFLFPDKVKNKLNDKVKSEDNNLLHSYPNFTNQIDIVSNSRIIHNIEPFNSLFYKNCFYNSLFPILKFYGIDILSMLVNDVVVYEYKENDCMIDICYKEVLGDRDILRKVGLYLIESTNIKDVIQNLKECLNNEKPVILGVDCYYLSIRQDTYRKDHWPHTILIYGYDDNSECFNIIEHLSRDSLSYANRVISYYDIKEAYLSFKNLYPKFLKGIDFYQFDYIQPEVLTLISDIFKSNFKSKHKETKFGLEQLKTFCQTSIEFFDSRDFIETNMDKIISSLNNVINAKMSQMYVLESIFSSNDSSLLILKQILNLWEDIRVVIWKYKFSGIYNTSKIGMIKEMLFHIYEDEKRYYCELEKKVMD